MPRTHTIPRTAPWAALLLGLFLAPLLARSAMADGPPVPLDPATRDFDQLHLDLHVTPHIAKGTIDGKATLRFASLADGLTVLRLHCQDTEVHGVVDASGRKLTWHLTKNILSIDLPGPLAVGAESEVTTTYTSTPRHGLLFHAPTAEHPQTPRFLYSQGEGTNNRRWIPCYDEPDDRLSWDVFATVPADLQTVSNGHLVAGAGQGDHARTDHWTFAHRAPTYLISLIVGKLETITQQHGDIQLDYSAPPGHHAQLASSLSETPNMLDFYGTYLDAPYPWQRYAQTYVWDFLYGGMENVTATTLNMRALHTPATRPNYSADGLVAHELAHMWFGDLLTCRTWKHIWLNEGFATYMTDLFFEHRYGRDAFLVRRRGQNRGYMRSTPTAGGLKLKADPRGDIPLELFGGKEYSRGAGILHTLRLTLGDEVFRDALRAYVKRYRDQPVTSENLRRTCEEVAGMDLSWFWKQWVYGSGYPKLDVRFDRGTHELIVRQTQKRAGGQGLFRLRVPVRWGADGSVQTVTITKAEHRFPYPEQDGGTYLRFGVGGDLLMQVVQHQGRGAWAEQLARDPDVTARMDAAEALETYGQAAVDVLSHAIGKDASWAVRKTAAEVLGRLEGGNKAHLVLAALRLGTQDADARVRAAAVTALGNKTRDMAGAVVARALKEDVHPYVRAAAARALGRLKGKGAFETLAALLGVDSDQVGAAVIATEKMLNLIASRPASKKS